MLIVLGHPIALNTVCASVQRDDFLMKFSTLFKCGNLLWLNKHYEDKGIFYLKSPTKMPGPRAYYLRKPN
jgi:hypothetical protein